MKYSNHKEHRTGSVFLLIFILLTTGILSGGYFAYRTYEQNYRAGEEYQLSAVAELKIDQLVEWRKERLGDANMFHNNAVFSGLVKRYFENQNDADAKRKIQAWMGQISPVDTYDRICLRDIAGIERISFPEGNIRTPFIFSARSAEVLKSGKIEFQDFYRDENDKKVYLAVFIPILDEYDKRKTLGILAMRIDPSQYLYPMIEKWPTPGRTSETLIIRREGNDALFLNDLKFRKDAALNLRISLENKEVAAVKAALGQTGIVEGVDYRGEPVIADVRAVPNSPWFLVSRTDISEVYAPLRERLWLIAFLIGTLIISSGAVVGLVWRQQRSRFYQEQYKLSEALRASEVRYRRLFESAQDGILILDADSGQIIDVNPFLIEMLGYFHEEFLGKELWEIGIFKNIAASKAAFIELQQQQYIRFENMPLETKDRRHINVEFVSNVYLVDRKKVVQCNIRDITERKKIEEKLALLMENLKRSNTDLEQFAYVASHDLQEPLRMVSSFVQLLADRYEGKLNADADDFIRFAVDGANRMQQLISDLLTYSRIGKNGEKSTQTDCETVLAEAETNLKSVIQDSNAVITHDPLPTVDIDESQLLQVFQNLLSNSIKFRSKESPRIHISAMRQNNEWTFSVRDNGIGIDPQFKDRIFIIFQRLHSKEEYPGTGMGLAICKKIIERNRGQIRVTSEPGKGSIFYFTLPIISIETIKKIQSI